MKDIFLKLLDLLANPWFYIPSLLLGLILYNYVSIAEVGQFVLGLAERAKVTIDW